MHGTRSYRHHRPSAGPGPYAPQPYWGWSHQNQRMEYMDYPSYMDSIRQGYDAFGGLWSQMQPGAGTGAPPWPGVGYPYGPAAPASGGPRHARHHRHDHGHDEHHWDRDWGCEHRDCGCGHHERCDDCERHGGHRCGEHDCRCECCIVDADIVVYAHCGETRVIPIEVANDTRKIREDIEVHVSEVRSAGGRVLPWAATLHPAGTVTLQPCSKTHLELIVHISCGEKGDQAAQGEAAEPSRERVADVDRCEVGYVTVRLEGCVIRPIVVAVAALPLSCDSYRTGCSCSCCC